MTSLQGTRKPRVRPQRGEAFTLIELLVVVAIIALLIAVLMPSLAAARRAAKKATCLAQIKNIASSSHVYGADDPRGWVIPVHPRQYDQDPDNPSYIGAYEWGGKSGIGRPDFLTGTPDPLFSKYGTRAGFGPATRPLNEILYPGGFKNNEYPWDRVGALQDTQLDLPIYRCPGDDGPPGGVHCRDWRKNSERSSYDQFGNSYTANKFMVVWGRGDCVQSNSVFMRPLSRVPTPDRALMYEENIGRFAWAARRTECIMIDTDPGWDPGPTKAIRSWHGADWTFNRAFVDAHAEPQKLWIEGTEDDEGYAEHYYVEHLSSYPGIQPNCDGEVVPGIDGMYHCLIVRGPGWAKDTLPAPLIHTGIHRRYCVHAGERQLDGFIGVACGEDGD